MANWKRVGLGIWTDEFQRIKSGEQKFVIEWDGDENINIGDILVLEEDSFEGNTGEVQTAEVTSIERRKYIGLTEGWICMSIRPIENDFRGASKF